MFSRLYYYLTCSYSIFVVYRYSYCICSMHIFYIFYLAITLHYYVFLFFFFFKQKRAYEMRISDWSSDVCSSDRETWKPSSPRRRRSSTAHSATSKASHLGKRRLCGGPRRQAQQTACGVVSPQPAPAQQPPARPQQASAFLAATR